MGARPACGVGYAENGAPPAQVSPVTSLAPGARPGASGDHGSGGATCPSCPSCPSSCWPIWSPYGGWNTHSVGPSGAVSCHLNQGHDRRATARDVVIASATGAGAPASNCRALVGCQHTQPRADPGVDLANGHAFGDSCPRRSRSTGRHRAGIVGDQRGGPRARLAGAAQLRLVLDAKGGQRVKSRHPPPSAHVRAS